MKLFKKAKKGFTLVELVVVIAVIAILAAVSVGAYFGVTDSANRSKLEQEAKQAYTNIQLVSLVDSKDGFDLDIDGLSIDKLDDFQREVAKAGGDYDLRDSNESINENKPTVIFSETAVQAENTTKTYKQFDYYIPTISGMHANCNLLNGGKITIVKGDNPVFGEGSNTPVVPDEPEHEHEFINGKCSCGEEDQNYEPPHEHTFVKGECTSCGEPDPDYRNPITGLSINGEEEVTLTLLSSKDIYQIDTTLIYQDPEVATTDTDYTISYTSSVTDFATVSDSGLVKAEGTGESVITATVKVGEEVRGSDSIKVIVNKVAVSVSFAETTKTKFIVGEDKTYKFEATANGENLDNTSVTWSATGVDITEDGTVSFGGEPFAATITATSVADPTAFKSIKINLDKKPTEINLLETSTTLNINEEYDFADKVSFGNATINKEYRITSSNTNVVTVNGTKIKAVAYSATPITVTVTLTTNTEINKTFTVNINNPISSVKITDGTNEISSIELTLGDRDAETKTVNAVLTSNYASSASYAWSVEGTDQGNITINSVNTAQTSFTAVKEGDLIVKVIVSVFGSTSEKTINVKVNAPAENISTGEIVFSNSDLTHKNDSIGSGALNTFITSGSEFIASSTYTQVYKGTTDGIRLGSNNNNGSLTLNLNVTVKSVTIIFVPYPDDACSLEVNDNSVTSGSEINSINSNKLEFASVKRVFLSKISFTYLGDDTGGTETPEVPNPGGNTGTPETTSSITFTLDALGKATTNGHNDGTTGTSYTETKNGHTLSITDGKKFSYKAQDASGNTCFKLGTSDTAGEFKINLANETNVKSIDIMVAGYKNRTCKVQFGSNSVVSISGTSNNNSYTKVSSSVEGLTTITFKVTTSFRCMISSIVFNF